MTDDVRQLLGDRNVLRGERSPASVSAPVLALKGCVDVKGELHRLALESPHQSEESDFPCLRHINDGAVVEGERRFNSELTSQTSVVVQFGTPTGAGSPRSAGTFVDVIPDADRGDSANRVPSRSSSVSHRRP